MLKGRSKSFAPKSIPRAPKRKAPDDTQEPPAKRVSTTPDQPPAATPEIQHIPAQTPDTIPAIARTNPDTENVTNNSAPAREPSPRSDARFEPQLATQDIPMVDRPAIDKAPARETSPVVNTAPEIQTVAPAVIINEQTPEPPRLTSEPEAPEEPVLPSIETNDRQQSRSPFPNRHVLSKQPQFRYPSPQNIARIVESGPAGVNMGPPGGQLGAAGDVAAIERTGEIVQMAVLNPDGTTGKIVDEPASGTEKGKKKKKAPRRRKVQEAEVNDDDTRATIDMGLQKAKRQATKRAAMKKPGRKEREATPSDAEEEIIDPTTLTMTDLCQDLRIGKKFSLHDIIKQRAIKKKQESQRNRLRTDPVLNAILIAEDQADDARLAEALANRAGAAGPSGTNPGTRTEEGDQPAAQKEGTTAPEGSGVGGPQFRIVDGNIVLDEQSLMVDRQREAEAARAEMEEVEENDFTKTFNSGSFLKREKTMQWDEVATNTFYKGLSRYGTDFETIAKLFPHRTRRHIKLKFNAEEKRNPVKITRYLTQPKKAMDLDHFERMSGVKLESVETIEAEHARLAAEHEASLAKVIEDMAAADRAKKAEIAKNSERRAAAKRILDGVGDSDDEDMLSRAAGESSKENAAPGAASTSGTGKGKKKAAPRKRSAKNKHSMYEGGEEIILGSIE